MPRAAEPPPPVRMGKIMRCSGSTGGRLGLVGQSGKALRVYPAPERTSKIPGDVVRPVKAARSGCAHGAELDAALLRKCRTASSVACADQSSIAARSGIKSLISAAHRGSASLPPCHPAPAGGRRRETSRSRSAPAASWRAPSGPASRAINLVRNSASAWRQRSRPCGRHRATPARSRRQGLRRPN